MSKLLTFTFGTFGIPWSEEPSCEDTLLFYSEEHTCIRKIILKSDQIFMVAEGSSEEQGQWLNPTKFRLI